VRVLKRFNPYVKTGKLIYKMKLILQKLKYLLEDLKNFGFKQSAAFVLYLIGKKLGYFQRVCPQKTNTSADHKVIPFLFPAKKNLIFNPLIIEKADQILPGQFCAFGMNWRNLVFSNADAQHHWTKARLSENEQDIKLIWEPARFDWVIPLGMAYTTTEDPKNYHFFKEKMEEFWGLNPVNMGLNWQSGQEVSIRMVNLAVAYSLFAAVIQVDQEFKKALVNSIYQHALRIRPSIIYAFAQNNNHLLSEAVGLITAGVFFPTDKKLARNKKAGIRWLNYCLQNQFYVDGGYLQHSTNYHRLVLDWLIWIKYLEKQTGKIFIEEKNNLVVQKAIGWLLNNTDPISGEMANYGHNDGAFLFQFADNSFRDVRPTLELIARLFGVKCKFPDFVNQKSNWLGFDSLEIGKLTAVKSDHRIDCENGWGIIRTNRFKFRPAHADQNHVDLWYQGVNVICDAGTYSYNLESPWHNALAKSKVHNTLTINQNDQMTISGTFRWRDWSIGKMNRESNKIVSEVKNSVQNQFVHQRQFGPINSTEWVISDTLRIIDSEIPPGYLYLHWLVKDCPYEICSSGMIRFNFGKFKMELQYTSENKNMKIGIIYKGESIQDGFQDDPNLGWFSPTYDALIPAISVVARIPVVQKVNNLQTRINFIKC